MFLRSKILLITLLIASCSMGQSKSSFSYTQYGVADGLPSSEVYQSIEDDEGYLWFATDRGVARFNGHRFERFSLHEGFIDVTIFGMTKDPNGRIWFFSYSNDLYYHQNGVIYRHCLSDSLKKMAEVITAIHVSDTMITVVDEEGVIIESKLDCSVVERATPLPDQPGYLELNVSNSPLFSIHFNAGDPIEFIRLRNVRQDSILTEKTGFQNIESYKKVFAHRFDQTYYCIFNYDLLIYKPGEDCQRIHFSENLKNALLVKDGSLWLGTENGVYRYSLKDLDQTPEKYLDGFSITSIVSDREGGYWFTTHNNGVLYAPVIENQCFSATNGLSNERVDAATALNGQFYIGGYDGSIYNIDPNLGEIKRLADIDEHVQEITSTATGKVSFANQYEYDPETTILTRKRELANTHTLDNAYVLFRIGDTLSIYHRESMELISQSVLNVKSYKHTLLRQGELWLGGRFGLVKTNGLQLSSLAEVHSIFGSRISDLISINDSTIAVATLGGGIALLTDEKSVTIIDAEDGLADDLCNRLLYDEEGVLWVGTNAGLSKISNPLSANRHIENLDISDGLVSDLILGIARAKEWVLVTTNRGVSLFREQDLHPAPERIPVYISHIRVNGETSVFNPDRHLKHRENNLQFHFDAVSFKHRASLEFRYRLKRFTGWTVTHNNELEFNSLPPGEYHLEIQAGDGHGWWAPGAAEVRFVIDEPLWQRNWFIGLMMAACIAVLLVATQLRIHYLRRHQRLLTKISFYQNQALASQINPHFIFNSLNSIQAYAVRNDANQLTAFVSRFAKLIRLVFEVMSHRLIPLDTEIDLLKRYLEFESLRFREKMSYDLVIEGEEDLSSCFIPPLLIQPIVENAIKHGAMKDEEHSSGHVKIVFSMTTSLLSISVLDNGKGFESSKQSKRFEGTPEKPSGMGLVKKRLQLLEQWLGKPCSFNVYSDSDGTEVVVSLPILKSKPNE